MARRVIETLTGVGAVYADDVLLRTTSYALEVWRDEGNDESVHVEGRIDVTGLGEAVVLAGPGVLTLHLADGRRLPFTLTASTGHIVGRGGLQRR
jgi:hypothetical protein